jgi:hypothetical protein
MNVADDGNCIRTAAARQMSHMPRMEAKTWDVKSTARDRQSPASDYYRWDDQGRRDQRAKSGLQQAGNRHPDNGTERVECLQPTDALAPLAFRCELDDEQACYSVRGCLKSPDSVKFGDYTAHSSFQTSGLNPMRVL